MLSEKVVHSSHFSLAARSVEKSFERFELLELLGKNLKKGEQTQSPLPCFLEEINVLLDLSNSKTDETCEK